MNNHLAIIIPAYKTTYLHETLQSISSQTCKEFTLYIGDDASPNNIYEIVKEFERDINIVYKRFDGNLGGLDLIAHWNRCIEMSVDEEWIWLFSDDDIMAANCVEKFRKYLESGGESQLLHFNTDIIDGKGKKYADSKPFPLKMSSSDFFERRMSGEIFSFVVEYIFTRKLYLGEGKFEKFDLAWCSDDATWVKFAKKTGISTMDNNALVYWRYSGENISSLNIDESILFRKLNAKAAYLNWAIDFFKNNKETIHVNIINKVKWILFDLNQVSYLPFTTRCQIAYKYASMTGNFINGLLGVLYISYSQIKHWNKKRL
jgi:glycosyltransferase involved in cell wall biosynthesis